MLGSWHTDALGMLMYWFSLLTPELHPSATALWGGLAVLAILAGVLLRRVVVPRQRDAFARKPWRRTAHALTTTGILLLALLFFRAERIPFFGSRFWLLLLAIGDAVWIAAIVRHARVHVPQSRAAWAAEQQKRKYLT